MIEREAEQSALNRLHEKADAGIALPAPGRVQHEDAGRFVQAVRRRPGRQGQVATWAIRLLAAAGLLAFLAALIAALVSA